MTRSDSEPGTVDATTALTEEVAESARLLFSAGGVTDTLARILELSVTTIEGCDWAGIFVVVDGQVATPLQTDPKVSEIDNLQLRLQEGPCLDALRRGAVVYAGDLNDNRRWPALSQQAASSGVRSLLALPLIDQHPIGALNLYARYPEAFGVVDRARGLLLATMAAMALSTARSHEAAEHQAAHLHLALTNREMIGQAQGILMEREGITADGAFDILRRASQHLNVKLRDVAQSLVETGERPDTGGTSDPG